MSSDGGMNRGGFSQGGFKRPAPRSKDVPAQPAESPGPLPMGPPPSSMPAGAPQPIPAGAPQPAPAAPSPGVQPAIVPGQLPAVRPVDGAGPAALVASQAAGRRRGPATASAWPFVLAGGACLLLAAIGVVALFALRGARTGNQPDQTGTETEAVQRPPSAPTTVVQAAPKERAFQAKPDRRVVDGIHSDLDRVPVAIDDQQVLADAGDGKPQSVTVADGQDVFDGRMPTAADLDLPTGGTDQGSTDGATPEPDAEPPVEEEPAERPEPFTEMPDRFGLPPLPATAGGATPVPVGAVHKLESDEVSFALEGAREALGGRGAFAVRAADQPNTAEVLLSQAGGAPDGTAVARWSVQDGQLGFQWLADETVADADALRNCNLVVTVADQSKSVSLREPEVVPPLKVDVSKGVAAFKKKMRAVPRSASVELEITGMGAGFPAHTFRGPQRLASSKQTVIRINSTSQQELLSLHVLFSASRSGEVSIEVRPIGTDGKLFGSQGPRQVERELAALEARKQVLQKQFLALPSRNRIAAQAQFDRQIAALDAQIAYCQELQTACQQLATGEIHFRVSMNLGGRTVDLLTTGSAPQAAFGELGAGPAAAEG